MNQYQFLINNLKDKFKKDTDNYLFRISMKSDLERVKKFGSTRLGLSPKIWDKINNYPKELFPKYPVLHEDMIIASYWIDLEEDVKLENGTLKHKLEIYEEPFFTIYKKDNLLEIGKEESMGQNNQGRHFFFKESPINCLDSLWQIKNNLEVEEIKWR